MCYSFSSKLMPLILAILLALAAPAGHVLAQGNRVIYEDDFPANVSGWTLVSTTSSALNVNDGILTLQTTAAGQASWVTPALTIPDDAIVEVEAVPVDPPSNGQWNVGLILRADTRGLDASFYHFGVTGAGRWEFRVRPKDSKTYTNAVQGGQLSNFDPTQPIQFRVEARGNIFAFSVNGTKVGTFQDASISSDPSVEKYLGLMTGTYENAKLNKVQFRKLVVTEGAVARILMQDTFASNNPNNWGTEEGKDDHLWIENSALHMAVTTPGIIAWSLPSTKLPADIDLTLSAQVISANSDSNRSWDYGVGVRGYIDSQKPVYYLLELIGTGNFTFTARRGGQISKTLIASTALDNFDPYSKHTLRIVAQGSTFTLYVNGQQVGSATDNSLKSQSTYSPVLVAGTFSDASQVEVAFSDLIVTEP